MKQSTLNKLKRDSTFYDNLFKYTVTKVYRNKSIVNGVQAFSSWENGYGRFSETKYFPKKELLAKEYADEFVQI